jgi:hypothetical protein
MDNIPEKKISIIKIYLKLLNKKYIKLLKIFRLIFKFFLKKFDSKYKLVYFKIN